VLSKFVLILSWSSLFALIWLLVFDVLVVDISAVLFFLFLVVLIIFVTFIYTRYSYEPIDTN